MNKWISVAENLPAGNGIIYAGCLEESPTVLVYGRDYEGKEAYGIGEYVRDHNSPQDNGWCGYMHDSWELDQCSVTHWMPMPEPPSEDKV